MSSSLLLSSLLGALGGIASLLILERYLGWQLVPERRVKLAMFLFLFSYLFLSPLLCQSLLDFLHTK